MKKPVYVGLVHHPVVNRRGEPVISAITNLDIHDIARTCRTFGVNSFFVINPSETQLMLLNDIMAHWKQGVGGKSNPERKEAFSVVKGLESVEMAISSIEEETGMRPEIWTTSARDGENRLCWQEAKRRIDESGYQPVLILFGTAGGLAEEVFSISDFIIEPIKGKNCYNHLSVRSAVAITLDRLLSRRI